MGRTKQFNSSTAQSRAVSRSANPASEAAKSERNAAGDSAMTSFGNVLKNQFGNNSFKTNSGRPYQGKYTGRRTINRRAGELSALDGVLGQVLRNRGLDKKIARYMFVTHWSEIVGEAIAKRTRPECLRNGALVVRVPSSAWAQELSFQKHVILNRLRKFIPADEVVTDVVFYVAGAAGVGASVAGRNFSSHS